MNQAVLNRSRSDKFLFVLDLPTYLKNQQDSVLEKMYDGNQIQFTTYGSPVPAITVPEKSVPFAGQVYHVSSSNCIHERHVLYIALSILFET